MYCTYRMRIGLDALLNNNVYMHIIFNSKYKKILLLQNHMYTGVNLIYKNKFIMILFKIILVYTACMCIWRTRVCVCVKHQAELVFLL